MTRSVVWLAEGVNNIWHRQDPSGMLVDNRMVQLDIKFYLKINKKTLSATLSSPKTSLVLLSQAQNIELCPRSSECPKQVPDFRC